MTNQVKRVLSGEWLLTNRCNGGFVVLFRAMWVAIPVYVFSVALMEIFDPKSQAGFSSVALSARISETLAWFGAIYGAVYAALYARFSSQWQYLAQLYNQLMEFGFSEEAKDPTNADRWNNWRAGFIEDACTLHLASKPMFAAAIFQMISEPGVQNAFRQSTLDGDAHLAKLGRELSAQGLTIPIHP
jgi:hypothetical protein